MAVFAQHGFGKSTKIDTGLSTGSIQGVVLSLKDEQQGSLASFVEKTKEDYPDSFMLIDPQFYISMYSPAKDRLLQRWPHYTAGRREADFTSGQRVRGYVKSTIDLQADMHVDVLVSPTIQVNGVDERSYQIALSLANESMEYHASMDGEDRELYLSFVLGEQVFNHQRGIDEFLDLITTWDIHGLYLIIDRPEAGYSQRFDPSRLANLMYAIHVLGSLNDINIVCGYTDIYGTLLRAVGAMATASGWSQGCRRHHRPAFLERRGGGRRPRPRYLSLPLLNSIILGELDLINDVDELDSVLSGTRSDAVLTAAASPTAANWDAMTATQQHWEALSLLDSSLGGDVETDLQAIEERIESARLIYTELQELGVEFERGPRGTGDGHLDDWAEAIQLFRGKAGL